MYIIEGSVLYNDIEEGSTYITGIWACILVQVTLYRTLGICRDDHLDKSQAYDISWPVPEFGHQIFCIAEN